MKKGTEKSKPAKKSAVKATSAKPKAARASTKKSTKKAAGSKATTAKSTKAKAAARTNKKNPPIEYDTPARSEKEAYLRRLADLFGTSAKPEVIAARALEDETLFLRFDIDGYEIALSVADVRLVEGSIEKALEKSKGLRGRYNRIKRPEELSIDELKERNLPLYWNEEWLRRELDRLGSYSEIARTHGFPSATTIASYAKRKFGISIQKNFDEARAKVIEEFDTGDYTQLELAEKHGVGVATVYRWLAERKPASGKRGRTAKTPEQREKERQEAAKKKAAAAAAA